MNKLYVFCMLLVLAACGTPASEWHGNWIGEVDKTNRLEFTIMSANSSSNPSAKAVSLDINGDYKGLCIMYIVAENNGEIKECSDFDNNSYFMTLKNNKISVRIVSGIDEELFTLTRSE